MFPFSSLINELVFKINTSFWPRTAEEMLYVTTIKGYQADGDLLRCVDPDDV